MDRKFLFFLLALAIFASGFAGDKAGLNYEGEASASRQSEAKFSRQRSQLKRSQLKLTLVDRFQNPLYVTAPPGDKKRLFVVEQGGKIWLLRSGKRLKRPFLNLTSRVLAEREQGLLSLAFAPDYQVTHRFYVYYTDKQGKQRIAEYRSKSENLDQVDMKSERLVILHEDPERNHNGGLLLFGPDKLLYIGTGDGGGAFDQHGQFGNAQDLASPLGKILRIDPRPRGDQPFTVPESNPFVRTPNVQTSSLAYQFGNFAKLSAFQQSSQALPEVFVYGLRNPWRFSFDVKKRLLIIGDVGQHISEEITALDSRRAGGKNLGWRPFEGSHRNFQEPAPGAVKPQLEHTHGQGWCSVIGGHVIRDQRLGALVGKYIYGDLCQSSLYLTNITTKRATGERKLAGLPEVTQLASFGIDAFQRLYVVSLAGPVYRLDPK